MQQPPLNNQYSTGAVYSPGQSTSTWPAPTPIPNGLPPPSQPTTVAINGQQPQHQNGFSPWQPGGGQSPLQNNNTPLPPAPQLAPKAPQLPVRQTPPFVGTALPQNSYRPGQMPPPAPYQQQSANYAPPPPPALRSMAQSPLISQLPQQAQPLVGHPSMPPPQQQQYTGAPYQPPSMAFPPSSTIGNTYNTTNAPPAPSMMPPPMNGGVGMQPSRFPPPQQHQPPSMIDNFSAMNLKQQGPAIDLLQEKCILGDGKSLSERTITLPNTVENPSVNCDPSVFRCTMNAVPQTQELLKRSRLPLALTLHPFRDMKNLTVVNTGTIVRCRSCRTYINPFVRFPDQRRWKCNVCLRVNDLPDDFCWDPKSKSYGFPSRRPEIRNATVEYIAPQEYMPIRKNLSNQNELRPPQPAVYLFVLDVSTLAIESGYLHVFCEVLADRLGHLPGTEESLIGFITVDAGVHFWQFTIVEDEDEGSPSIAAKQLIVTDLDDMFIPSRSGLLVNLMAHKESLREFIQLLPSYFESNTCKQSALGAAISIAREIIADIGGRITVLQTVLPDVGPGALTSREDPNLRASNKIENMGPATDFYKQFALQCSGNQIAVDLIMLNSTYADVATLSEMSRFCGGCVYSFPNFNLLRNGVEADRFKCAMRRYLTRRIGFEAVLRIRCTKGLAIQSFHGNFFVRSTDLLALPNVNPESAIGVHLEMEENLSDMGTVSFQAALLYTSQRGDRRIRVHTMCLPVVNSLMDIHTKVDITAMVSMLAKFAAERTTIPHGGGLADAREALLNAGVDTLGAFAHSLRGRGLTGLPAPHGGDLRLLPLFVIALLKHRGFASGQSVKLDERVMSMCRFRTLGNDVLMLDVYPALYPLHTTILGDQQQPLEDTKGTTADMSVERVQLSYERIDRHGLYLMDTGMYMYLYVGQAVSDIICRQLFGVNNFRHIDEDAGLPCLEEPISCRIRAFIEKLNAGRAFAAPLKIIREDSSMRELFVRRLVEDRTESSHSYVEFLQHIRKEIAK